MTTMEKEEGIKEAVRVAIANRGNPILLECCDKEDTHNEEEKKIVCTIVYWPSTQEIGEKFLIRLNETMTEEQLKPIHSQLVDLILVLHRGQEKAKRSIQVNTTEIDSLIGPNAIDRLGVFLRIHGRSLTSCLYRQECRIFS